MYTYEVDVNIFGETIVVLFEANETVDELNSDDRLLDNYVMNAIRSRVRVDGRVSEV